MSDQPGTPPVCRCRQLREGWESIGDCRWLKSCHIGQTTSRVKVRQTTCQAGGGQEVLAWKPWKVVHFSTHVLVYFWFCMCQQTKDIRGLSATWKAWKVEAWNARQLTSAGQKAGQDDALTDLGGIFFCKY